MDLNYVTTPFGRRAMTLAMLTEQTRANDAPPDQRIDKWKLYRDLCEARSALGVTDRSLALLNALLSFYPKTELSRKNGLVVFPSNQQLSLRANGMAEPTIRRHIGLLVAAGLITRKDSANGKRYVRRDRKGEIGEAFGFSLAPLLVRADEIERLAQNAIRNRLDLQRAKETLTILRRDVAKLIALADAESLATRDDRSWAEVHNGFRDIIDAVPRKADIAHVLSAVQSLADMRADIMKCFELQINDRNLNGSASQNERHIQRSESESHFDSPFECLREEAVEATLQALSMATTPTAADTPITLALVLKACPDITDYGPMGRISDWQDLTKAAQVVSSMLNISASAIREAREKLGLSGAAILVACILERSPVIASPGGYLRRLTREAGEGRLCVATLLGRMLQRQPPDGPSRIMGRNGIGGGRNARVRGVTGAVAG